MRYALPVSQISIRGLLIDREIPWAFLLTQVPPAERVEDLAVEQFVPSATSLTRGCICQR
jgi:hypothetical protein